ncbi:hypothetical protein D3C86_2129220 [compost metagenome]
MARSSKEQHALGDLHWVWLFGCARNEVGDVLGRQLRVLVLRAMPRLWIEDELRVAKLAN